MSARVVEAEVCTAWGRGADACWRGVRDGRCAFADVTRFDTGPFPCRQAACVPGLRPEDGDSLVMQMLRPMLEPLAGRLPRDTLLLLASTTGEVDLLERSLMAGVGAPEASRLAVLLQRVAAMLRLESPGRVVSAACVSSAAAVAEAAARIAGGTCDSVLIVTCDAVTEFVFAGFSSLLALDPEGARPFDRHRKGLTVGEGAAYVWLMSAARAAREGRASLGEVAGWGLSCDANHMTGPSRDGAGLCLAVRQALVRAGVEPAGIGSVCAHGTGTVYNDAMEMQAFHRVFDAHPVPTYSIKGSIGHTMGAAGLIEMIMALRSMSEGVVPATAGLGEPDPVAAGWVSRRPVNGLRSSCVMSTNSGFGGVNAALVLRT